MKIVIANGTAEAAFIIRMFKSPENELVVINADRQYAETLMNRENIPVFVGQPWRNFVLQDAGAHDADVFISLSDKDTDNYATCMLAKKIFNAKKCICVVRNPGNVDLYKKLGVDSVISSTYLLAQSVKSESSMEELIKTLSLENDKIVLIEAVILSKYRIAGQKLMNIDFPKFANISCIYRNPQIIIPNGQTIIEAKDTLVIACAPENQEKVLAFVRQEK